MQRTHIAACYSTVLSTTKDSAVWGGTCGPVGQEDEASASAPDWASAGSKAAQLWYEPPAFRHQRHCGALACTRSRTRLGRQPLGSGSSQQSKTAERTARDNQPVDASQLLLRPYFNGVYAQQLVQAGQVLAERALQCKHANYAHLHWLASHLTALVQAPSKILYTAAVRFSKVEEVGAGLHTLLTCRSRAILCAQAFAAGHAAFALEPVPA